MDLVARGRRKNKKSVVLKILCVIVIGPDILVARTFNRVVWLYHSGQVWGILDRCGAELLESLSQVVLRFT